MFAYAIETACDKFGWILGYTVNPGNLHDSKTFKGLDDKIKQLNPETIIADLGYRTPAIAKNAFKRWNQTTVSLQKTNDQRRLFPKI